MSWANTFKSSSAVIEPDDNVVGVTKIRPDQVVVAVVVYVIGEQRSSFVGRDVEIKNVMRLRFAEADVDTSVASCSSEFCTINAVIAIEVRQGKRLPKAQGRVCGRSLLKYRLRK
ncbi:MAG TPA: hypothetical protein VKM94_08805 [Blastocatellia bacterium]|nr:hypothetical protein [Blastocatellia bacterium]